MAKEPVVRGTRVEPIVAKAPFRLRHLLALGLAGLLVSWVWPRGQAAWQLHNMAVAYADYALCMVGPTGPEVLQAEPEQFLELARRRVITAMPEERPFSSCQKFTERLPLPHAAYRVHGAQAADFVEYHNAPAPSGTASLAQLELSLSSLDALSTRAWPFVRNGASKLMKPSSHAKEAAHVAAPPSPGWGSGLPATRALYRSTASFGDTVVLAHGSGANAHVLISKNRGIDFRPGGRQLASELQDRCVVDDEGRAFTISRLDDGRRIVLSQGPGAPPQLAALGSDEEEVAAISCDESALVAALVQPKDKSGYRPIRLRLCHFRRPCKDLSHPSLGDARLYYPADVARIGGDTVVARTSGGVTRVASSRDDGRTWTPWIVAFDTQSSQVFAAPPFRLLVVGDDLLLYSGAAGGQKYPLLVSRDHGASFHPPETQVLQGPRVRELQAQAQR